MTTTTNPTDLPAKNETCSMSGKERTENSLGMAPDGRDETQQFEEKYPHSPYPRPRQSNVKERRRRWWLFGFSAVYTFLFVWMGSSTSLLQSRRISGGISVVVLDRLLYVSFCFLAFATWMGGLLTVNTGLFLRVIIFVLNSLFLWSVADRANVSLTVLAGVFLGTAVAIMGGAMNFWIVAVREVDEAKVVKATSNGDFDAQDKTVDMSISQKPRPPAETNQQPSIEQGEEANIKCDVESVATTPYVLVVP